MSTNSVTATETATTGAVLPCGGVCQVDNWTRGTVWCCPAHDGDWTCTREEGHTGPHIACRTHSDDPGHHRLHTWPTTAPVMACCGGILGEHITEVCPLVAELTDRRGRRYVTLLGDSREHPVRCRYCADPNVWALDSTCDRCAIRHAEQAA